MNRPADEIPRPSCDPDLGYMLYDLDHSNRVISARNSFVRMVNGVLDPHDCEVSRDLSRP